MIGIARPTAGLFLFILIGCVQPQAAKAFTCVDPSSPQEIISRMGFTEEKSAGTELSEAEQSLAELTKLLHNKEKERNEPEAVKKQIAEFRSRSDPSPAETQWFWQQTVGAKDYLHRKYAVQLLVREQKMDNAPALIYAVSDPDFRIAFQAHQGLRLLSRKFESMKLSDGTIKNARFGNYRESEIQSSMRSEFKTMEARWTAWFLGIRPEAQMYKQNEPDLGEVTNE